MKLKWEKVNFKIFEKRLPKFDLDPILILMLTPPKKDLF